MGVTPAPLPPGGPPAPSLREMPTGPVGEGKRGAPPLLAAEGIVRRYGSRVVLDGVGLAVREGEVLAVLGPNGAGKSTLFRVLLTLERPDQGRVRVGGVTVGPGHPAARRLAGVFQRPLLFSGSVAHNAAYGLRVRGVPRSERMPRVDEVLRRLGLEALRDATVQTLSGGEAQRVALARALVTRPDVLLLDEPTASLDVVVRRRFRHELEGLLRTGARAAVLITHDAADAFALADRVVVLEAGRVVQSGTPEEIVSAPLTAFVAELTGAELLLDGTVESREDALLFVRLGRGGRLLAAADPSDPAIPAPGERVHVAYRPEDIVLVPADAGEASSARNRFSLVVGMVAPAGGLVRVRLEGEVRLSALLTRRSAEELGVSPGRPVAALVKATALRAYRAAPLRGEPGHP